jgi:fibronectin type 3 domain-containing protein
MPIDVFPPAAPRGLTAIAGEGITLDWDPNEDFDLGGYLILRGEAGGATLLQLFDTAISETRYTDRTVKSGVRYVYEVVAVDSRVPVPNRSPSSSRVEELAR